MLTWGVDLEHLTRGPSQHISQPLWAADHETMPSIASLNDIERTWFQLLGSVNNHLHYLRGECRLVLLSNHIRRGDMAPSGVCLRA